MVGFALRKLLKNQPISKDPVTQEDDDLLNSPTEEKRHFSLDFPPGLVHDVSECETSPKRWNALRRILDKTKTPNQ